MKTNVDQSMVDTDEDQTIRDKHVAEIFKAPNRRQKNHETRIRESLSCVCSCKIV